MTTQMIVRIDPHLKERLAKLARMEGKTSSEIVRELIESHLKDRDIGAYIDNLWDRIGSKLRQQGITPKNIDGAIKAARKKE